MQSTLDPECPPGHAVLPDAERLKHLAQLRERKRGLNLLFIIILIR